MSGLRAYGPAEWESPLTSWQSFRRAYRLRLKRQILIARAIRKRRELRALVKRTHEIARGDILSFSVLRNEMARLPHFLAHYRALGVKHFLMVDNASSDGSGDYLAAQPDVSLWQTSGSYRKARFGLDWLNWLLLRYGHGHWCLTLDIDEILIYPHHDSRPLPALTQWLEDHGKSAMASMMLELYPKGPLSQSPFRAGDNPLDHLPYFDSGNYSLKRQRRFETLWIQGGPRQRVFFAENPRQAPTLNKLALVHWNWRYMWLNSTHTILPARLNKTYEQYGGESLSGVLLHTKFLPQIVETAAEERARRAHFTDPSRYGAYYDALEADPDFYCAYSKRFENWRQLEGLGLISRGGWL